MCVCGVSYVLQDKSSVNKNKEFFKEKNQFDVLFFGSSHMELFVSPMDLWRDYGITSYNFGSPEQGLPVTYWVMKNAIAYNKPKVIVVDMHMFNLEGKYSGDEYLHFGLDSFPLTNTKMEAIKEMTKSKEEFIEMIFKLGKYHGNWKNISEAFFKNLDYYMMGSMSYGYYRTMNVVPFEQHPLINGVADVSSDSESYIYTKKIIELCKEEGIELLFVSTPFVCDSNLQMNIHAAEKIAEKNNIPYINFVDMNSVIDMRVDMYDEGHVNQSGMHKVTKYIGSYIKDNFNIQGHRKDELYMGWNQKYNEYKCLKYESIWYQDDLYTTLMMLHDEDITSYVYINQHTNTNIVDDEVLENLLQNIGRNNICYNDTEISKSSEMKTLKKVSSDYDNFMVKNCISKSMIDEYVDFDAYEEVRQYIGEYITEEENCIYIIVVDTEEDEVKLIKRAYLDGDKYNIDTLQSNISEKYLFR